MTKPKKENEQPKEHRRPWQEVYATPEDIKRYLSDHVMLRHNVVRGRTEIHWIEAPPELSEAVDKNLSEEEWKQWFREYEEWTPSGSGYRPLTDRDENSLWVAMSKVQPVRLQDLQHVIASDFVPEYHPFRCYLEHLPPWDEEQGDHIMGLSLSVNVRGDSEEQMLFYEYLRKWLVAMVASWADDRVVNNVMLVLIGEQGSYKTTWFSHLLPPELREYFYTKTNSGLVSKDDLLTLAQYGLVCWEELDSMQLKELNKLKAAMTMPSINERAAYARHHENRPHLASFCGTGNNVQFLSDPTGTRRWLPFEVESIESPLTMPFDHEAIFSQAYALYRQGFRYWFDRQEILQLTKHNEHFATPSLEQELINYYFRQPKDGEQYEEMPVSIALQIVGANITQKLTSIALGRAFMSLGYQFRVVRGQRRYFVIRRTPEELRLLRQGGSGEDGEDGEAVF